MLKVVTPFVALAALVWANTAAAAIYRVEAVGVVTGAPYDGDYFPIGTSYGGPFGVDGSIDGYAFRSAITYDSDLGIILGPGNPHFRDGGAAFGVPSPILTAWLEINGHREYFETNSWDGLGVLTGGGFGYVVEPPAGVSWFSLGLIGPGAPTSYDNPSLGTFTGVSWKEGRFHHDDEMWGGLQTTRMTISLVPEPSTWAMMIMGFGLAGAALRRRARPLAA